MTTVAGEVIDPCSFLEFPDDAYLYILDNSPCKTPPD